MKATYSNSVPTSFLCSLLALSAMTCLVGKGFAAEDSILRTPSNAAPAVTKNSKEHTTIRVTGTATEKIKNDVAVLTINVETRAETIVAAETATKKSLNTLMVFLKSIAQKDDNFQTQSLFARPLTDYELKNTAVENVASELLNKGTNKVQNKYVCEASVVCTVGLDTLAEILPNITAVGATSYTGIQFHTRSDELKAMRERLLSSAYHDALGKAKALAHAASISLGNPTIIAEGAESGGVMPMVAVRANMAGGNVLGGSAPFPTSSGENEVSASVTVEFSN